MEKRPHFIMFLGFTFGLIGIIILASCKEAKTKVKKEKPYVYHEGTQEYMEDSLIGIVKPCNQ